MVVVRRQTIASMNSPRRDRVPRTAFLKLAVFDTPRHQKQQKAATKAATPVVAEQAKFGSMFLRAASFCFVVCFSQVLDLSANSIEGLRPLAAALPALVELILDQNSLRALGGELVGLSKLKKLSARSNRISAVDPFSGQQVHQYMYLYCFSVLSFAFPATFASQADRAQRMCGCWSVLAV